MMLIYGRADITGWGEKIIFSVKVLAQWVLFGEKKKKGRQLFHIIQRHKFRMG